MEADSGLGPPLPVPRSVRLDIPHEGPDLLDWIRAEDPNLDTLAVVLEPYPELRSEIVRQANQLRLGIYPRPIEKLKQAALFLGTRRVRQVLSQRLRVDARHE